MHIAISNEIVLLTVKFRLRGALRFLSHAETLRVFQRACVRAGINIQYSKGFNPRPKMSLPLPRPVGVESDDELLAIRICKDVRAQEHKSTSDVYEPGGEDICTFVMDKLSEQLPEGCELLSVNIARTNTSFQPRSATYILSVRPEYLDEDLWARIERLLASKSLDIQRLVDRKNSKSRKIDIRAFLKSIKIDGLDIIVECNISQAGSIRIEEILKLLELDESKLASPIRRTNVQWQSNGNN
jgi:radical SAM-linked protein